MHNPTGQKMKMKIGNIRTTKVRKTGQTEIKKSRKGKGKGRGRGGTKGKGRGRGRGLAKDAPNFQVAGTSAAPQEPEPAVEEKHETPSEGKKADKPAKPGKVMPESKQKKSPKSKEPKPKKTQEPLSQDSNEARSSAVGR